MTDPNDPASPVTFPNGDNKVEELIITRAKGLTKREYFAALAMQGILARGGTLEENIALYAVEYADDLIAALNKKPGEVRP